MVKVKYRYHQRQMTGGCGKWVEEVKVYDDASAEGIQGKIDEFIKNDAFGYRTNIEVIDVAKL